MGQSVNAGGIITNKYDEDFKKVVIFLPVGTDWRLLKAQCYQESRLNPLAVSPVGAMGLCQFMPNTALDLNEKYSDLGDFWLPEVSIRAAAYYMGELNKFWSSPRSFMDRYMLALASYNAGAGNILKAQKLSGGETEYLLIIRELPNVKWVDSKQTIDYVNRIVKEHYIYLLFN